MSTSSAGSMIAGDPVMGTPTPMYSGPPTFSSNFTSTSISVKPTASTTTLMATMSTAAAVTTSIVTLAVPPASAQNLGTEWYEAGWVGPLTAMLGLYCILSALAFLSLWSYNYLNLRLELDFSRPRRHQNLLRYRPPTPRPPLRRDSVSTIATELGDPDEEAAVEELWLAWAERGFRMPPLEVLQAQEERRRAQRQLRDMDVMRRLQQAGMI